MDICEMRILSLVTHLQILVFSILIIHFILSDCRMPNHRRNNKKSTFRTISQQKLSVPELLQKAQECIDKMEFSGAIIYLKDALNKEPENIEIIDLTASTLMELGNDEEAFPVFSIYFYNY